MSKRKLPQISFLKMESLNTGRQRNSFTRTRVSRFRLLTYCDTIGIIAQEERSHVGDVSRTNHLPLMYVKPLAKPLVFSCAHIFAGETLSSNPQTPKQNYDYV